MNQPALPSFGRRHRRRARRRRGWWSRAVFAERRDAGPKAPAIGRLVAVAGNPNSGKSTLFNALTGLRQKVGNYPGVTVEKREGRLAGSSDIRLLDLPGTYSLIPHSPDEAVTRDVLLGRMPDTDPPDAVLIVVDAGNLERNLYLATQVLDLGIPAVVACNMYDTLERDGQTLDTGRLAERLGVPVVVTVGNTGRGVPELRQVIERICSLPAAAAPAEVPWRPPEPLDTAIREVARVVEACGYAPAVRSEGVAGLLLAAGDFDRERRLPQALAERLETVRQRLAELDHDDPAARMTAARYGWLEAVAEECIYRRRAGPTTDSVTDRADRVLIHRFWGLAIFAPMMAMLFFSIFLLAEPLTAAIERLVGGMQDLMTGAMSEGPLRDLLVEGILAGVGNVLVFFPQIALLFLFIAVLEDSGYMARAAFLMNRLMARVGLHGRSFIPLLSSHACAVPGIIATRTIENPRDRLTTILVAPLMGCSARLPVYTLLIAACLPGRAWLKAVCLVTLYGLGVATALLMAWLFKKTLLKGPVPAFLIELPPYRMPHPVNVLRAMWDRSRLFLTQAGTIILAMTVVMWALLNYPRDAARTAWYEQQRTALAGAGAPAGALAELDRQEAAEILRNSAVGRLGLMIEPAIRPLGFNWEIGIGILASFAAREVFVSTMGVVYSVAEGEGGDTPLREQLRRAAWPDGRPVFTPLAAVSLMVFYMLACQCVSTLAVVRQETRSWRWPAFMFAYMSLLAYVASLVVFQAGRALGLGTS